MFTVGGIAGYADNKIENCYNRGNVEATGSTEWNCSGVGGIVGGIGSSNAGNLNNCYNRGNIKGTKEGIGGIVGLVGIVNSDYQMNITNVYNIGTVTGEKVGGICGIAQKGYFYNCYWQNLVEEGLSIDWGGSTGVECYAITLSDLSDSGAATVLNGNPSSGAWNQNASINNGYPYLVNVP